MVEILVLGILGLAGAAAVLAPIVLADRGPGSDADPAWAPNADDAALDAEVDRYRAALRSGTLCRRCLCANPDHSRYCAECGRPLARTAVRA